MKKLFILIMLVLIPSLSFAQTKSSAKKATPKPSIEVVLNQQVEILNARIDSMNIAHEEAIEMVKNEQKEQYANYYSQMDSDLDRSLVILSIIWGAMGLLFGVVAPIWLNAKAEKSLKNEIKAFKEEITIQISEQNEAIEDKLSKHKEYIDKVRNEFIAYKRESHINKLLSEAQNLLDDDPEYAIDLLTQVIDLDKDNKDALLYRGIAYVHCENAADALSDFNDVLKLDPQLIRAYYNIGRVYSNTNQIELALENFNKALAINPESIPIYLGIARMYAMHADFDKAINNVDMALKIDNASYQAHRLKSRIYQDMADREKTEEKRNEYKRLSDEERQLVHRARMMQRR
ncbi:MAG: tetratricopeptide repeat protein [Alistipes sp.]|nr:tetratricopeptide repeat protein [Alistipes sp.]